MLALILSWLFLIFIEVTRNWFIIEVKHDTPNHILGGFYRIAVGFMWFAIFFKLGYVWYWLILFEVFSFWFIYDTLLNICRSKPLIYLDAPEDEGEDSIIDTFTQKYLHKELIWYLKAFLALATILIIIFYGDMTWEQINS